MFAPLTFLYNWKQGESVFYHDSEGQEQINHDSDICGMTINNVKNRRKKKPPDEQD